MSGSLVITHRIILAADAKTNNLFFLSQLLSPYRVERIATTSCDNVSHAGKSSTCQGAPDIHELTVAIQVRIVHVHHEAADGLVFFCKMDRRYGKNDTTEITSANIPNKVCS
jgi:methylthioribose-1-phosphate isomerase